MKKKMDFLRDPRFRSGALSTLLLCLVLGILLGLIVIADALEKEHAWRRDLSFNALTTQSDVTLQALRELEHPVHLYAVFSRGQEDLPLLELLGRYSAASPLITWEQVDPALNPALISRFSGITGEESVVSGSLIVYCPDTDRWRILSSSDFVTLSFDYDSGSYAPTGITYEKSITSAIGYVSRNTTRRAMILQGQGELEEGGTAVLAELLYANGYDVYYFTLNSAEANLSPEDLLVVLSPVRDFTDEEFAALEKFVMQGGPVLFTVDYSDPVDRMANYAALLRYYGFVPKNGVVVASAEEPATFYNGNRIYLLPAMQRTDVTMEMLSAQSTTLLMTASRAFETPEEVTDRSLIVSELLCSGEKSYLHDIADGTLTQLTTDETGPFTLALQSRRVTNDGYVSRAVVLGSSTMLTSQEIYAITDTEEFVVRLVRYLSGDHVTGYDIAPKAAIRPGLSAASGSMGTALLVMLPLLVLAAALIVLIPRRNR